MYMPPITATGSIFSILEWFGAIYVALPLFQLFLPKDSIVGTWLAMLSVDVRGVYAASKPKALSEPTKEDSE